jgi:hypothetical protein
MAARAKPKPISLEDRRRKRVELAVANPAYFGEVYVRPYTPRWDSPLPRVAGAMLFFAIHVRRGIVWTPPEWLKTTTLSQLYPLWLTYRWAANGNIDRLAGMLMSEEQKLAQRNLGVVSWHIEFNERLQRDFLDDVGRPLVEPDPDADKWTDSEIVVRRAGTSKDPTWQAKGLDSKGIQGARLTHLLGDDIVTPRSAGSPAMQEKAERLWDEQATTRVLEDGQALAIGNYNGDRDLLAKLSRRRSYKVFKRPSLHVQGDPATPPDDPADPDAVVALPEKWPLKRLQDEREEKPNKFRRIHLMDSTAESGEKLKVAWMSIVPDDSVPTSRWFIGLDPAPGGDGDDLDFFNLTVGGLHGDPKAGDQHLDIAACHDTRASAGDQVELLVSYVQRFSRIGHGVAAIGVPQIALDNYFKGAVLIGAPELAPLLVPIKGIASSSKTERLEALGPYAKSGWLRCCDGAWRALTSDAADQFEELSLFEQWRDFDSISHDDKLDGVDVCQRTAREFGGKGTTRTVKLTVG